MSTPQDFPARGRITSSKGDVIVFNPANTNYELHLKVGPGFNGPLDVPVEGLIRVTARKVWTVPSGGSWVQPIFGTPKIVQGRVKMASETQLVVQAGTMYVVEMPADRTAVELPEGGIKVGGMVNVTALPGASFELIGQTAGVGK